MPYAGIKKNAAFTFDMVVVDSSSRPDLKANPTIAAGDWKISKDGGALANLTTLPVVAPASSVIIKIVLSATEMNANRITIIGIDAAGAQWDDNAETIVTTPLDADIVEIQNVAATATDLTDMLTNGWDADDNTMRSDVIQIKGATVSVDNIESVFLGTGAADDVDLSARSMVLDSDAGDALHIKTSGASGGHALHLESNTALKSTFFVEVGPSGVAAMHLNSDSTTANALLLDNTTGGTGAASLLKLKAEGTGYEIDYTLGGVAGANAIKIHTSAASPPGGDAVSITPTDSGNNNAINLLGALLGSGLLTRGGGTDGSSGYKSTSTATNGNGEEYVKTGTGEEIKAAFISAIDNKVLISTDAQDLSATLDVNTKTFTTALDLTATMKTSVNTEVDNALDTAIPVSPTADSINERIKTMDDLIASGGGGDLAAILADTNQIQGKLPSKAFLTGTTNSDGDIQLDDATGVLATGAIASTSFAAGAITATVIANAAIDAATFAAGAIDAAAINTGAITAAKFAAGAIDAAAIATDAITAAKIAANAIGSSELDVSAVNEIRDAIFGLVLDDTQTETYSADSFAFILREIHSATFNKRELDIIGGIRKQKYFKYDGTTQLALASIRDSIGNTMTNAFPAAPSMLRRDKPA